jgi:hypothetical protein
MEILHSIWNFILAVYGAPVTGAFFKTVAFIYTFLIGYCAYLTIWAAWCKGLLPTWLKVIVAPWLIIFGVIDIAANYVLGTIIFMEIPRHGELTLSLRSKRYHQRIVTYPNFLEKWRHAWGVFLSWVLNPFSQAIGEGDHI